MLKHIPSIVVECFHKAPGKLSHVKGIVANLVNLAQTKYVWMELSVVYELADLQLTPSPRCINDICS